MSRWPTWTRNFLLPDEGRVIYADANFDVSHSIFFLQEFLALITLLLLAILWQQWADFSVQRQNETIFKGETPLECALDYRGADSFSLTFVQWQICSIVLACGFVPYTNFFWEYIFRDGDYRYIVHAVIVHTLWLVSWTLISLPLLLTWRQWRAVRAQAIEALVLDAARRQTAVDDSLAKLLNDQPISGWNSVGSMGALVGVFIGPVVHAMLS
jgi:hypothetical protein